MTYIVMAPAKTFNGTEITPVFVTDSVEDAKEVAVEYRTRYASKGWNRWANKVSIKSPKTAAAYMEMANKVASYGHQIDMASQGNSFRGQDLIDWANILRVRADELANPYCDN